MKKTTCVPRRRALCASTGFDFDIFYDQINDWESSP